MTHASSATASSPNPIAPAISPSASPWLFAYLIAITAAVPLESFLITLAARVHTPDPILFGMQFAIEASVYLMLGLVVVSRLALKKTIIRTPIDAPLLVILAIVTLTVAINNAPITGSLMNLRSALRYVAVFYLVVNLGLTRKQVGTLLHIILVCGGIQILAGLIQWIVGYHLKVWMLPHTIDIEVAGKSRNFALVRRGREIGSLFGTLGDTLYYGLFLLVVLAVALPRLKRWRVPEYASFASFFVLALMMLSVTMYQRTMATVYVITIILLVMLSPHRWRIAAGLGLACLLFTIAYSYSRAAAIVTGLTLAVYLGHLLGVRRIAAAGCITVALGLILLGGSLLMETSGDTYRHPRLSRRSIVANMTNIFSAEYLERSKRQRLGTVLGVAPTTLANAPLVGYGPNQQHTIKQLNEAPKTRLYKTLTKDGFEDVYWVALLCYTGIAGVIAVAWLGVRMAWTCAVIAWTGAHGSTLRWAGLAGLYIVLQAAVLMWFNRVPEIRSFSFFLWLLPALAYAASTAPPIDNEPTSTQTSQPAV